MEGRKCAIGCCGSGIEMSKGNPRQDNVDGGAAQCVRRCGGELLRLFAGGIIGFDSPIKLLGAALFGNDLLSKAFSSC